MKFKGRDSKFRTDNKRPGNRNLNPRHEAAPNTEREQRSDLIFGVLPVLEALRANARRVDKVFVAGGAGKEHRLNEIFELARSGRGNGRPHLPRKPFEACRQGGRIIKASRPLARRRTMCCRTRSLKISVTRRCSSCLTELRIREISVLLRTVECAGGDGVFIPERRAVGLTDTVAKSAAGCDRVCEGCEGHKPQPADQRAKRT